MIGYVGALDSWFDVSAVRLAAESRPDWQFQLIGRVENERVGELGALPNIRLVGEVPFGSLAGWLAGFHVGIIPFVINPLIEATDPIKLYRILRGGIASGCSGDSGTGTIWNAATALSGWGGLGAPVGGGTGIRIRGGVEERRSVARQETWDSRAEELDVWLALAEER